MENQKFFRKSNLGKIVLFVIALAVIILAAATTFGFNSSKHRYHQLTGIQKLQSLGFLCDGDYARAVYYDATCSAFGDSDIANNILDRKEIELSDSNWVWENQANEPFLHAATQVNKISPGYVIATGPLIDSNYVWVMPDAEEDSDSRDFDWLSIGPFVNSDACSQISNFNSHVRRIFPWTTSEKLDDSDKSKNGSVRALISLQTDFPLDLLDHQGLNMDASEFSDNVRFHFCIRAAYSPANNQKEIETKWIEVEIPPADELSPKYQQPKELNLRLRVFRDKEHKEVVLTHRSSYNPCLIGLRNGNQFVLEGDQFFAWSDFGLRDSEYERLKEVLSEGNSKEIKLHDEGSCRLNIEAYNRQKERCRGSSFGICEFGKYGIKSDDELLVLANKVAGDCQDMYNSLEDGIPSKKKLADCLQLKESVYDDFIDDIIILDNRNNPSGIANNLGYYDHSDPYVRWTGGTEYHLGVGRANVSNHFRSRFEMVALHEYLHEFYFEDLSLSDRIRFHQELLALIEDDDKRHFDYLGESDLLSFVNNQLYRHSHTHSGLKVVRNIIKDLNNVEIKQAILAELPESVKEEYRQFINDRHGFVAFIYEIFLAGGARGTGPYYAERVSGLNDFINENHFRKILYSEPTSFAWDWKSTSRGTPLAFNKNSRSKFETDLIAIEQSFELELRQSGFLEDYKDDYPLRVDNAIFAIASGLSDILREALSEEEVATFLNEKNNKKLNNLAQSIVKKIFYYYQDSRVWIRQDAVATREDEKMDNFIYLEIIPLMRYQFGLYSDQRRDSALDEMSILMHFFTEGYPILAMEVGEEPVSEWLDDHFNSLFDRRALNIYFKYHPKLEINQSGN